jgi:GAF domain-containing protein
MREIALEEYKQLVEEQGQALLDVVQSVALGDLDVEVEVPEGVDVLSDLAIGLEMMIDDIREMLAELEEARAESEQRVAEQTKELAATLERVQAAQRRYLRQEWEDYLTPSKADQDYFLSESAEGPTAEAWPPAMTTAVLQVDTVTESDEGEGQTLAVPIHLYGEVIGVLGFGREEAEGWSDDEIAAVEAIVEQVALALENQRLFDEEQQARSLMDLRVKELDCLNDIGHRMEEAPPIPELLQWVAERIPPAMQYPEVCAAAIEFEGQIYGAAGAVSLPRQMVQALRVGGQVVGRVYISYTEERGFLDEESALLGDIARRVSGYIESRRLFEQTQARAEELSVLFNAGRALTSARLQPKEIAEVVALQLVGMGSLECSLSLLEDGGDTLRVLTDLFVQEDGIIRWERADEILHLSDYPATVRVMETLQPLVVQAGDPDADPAELAYMRENEVETLVIIPLTVKGQAIGIMELESWDKRHYTPEQLNLIMTLANQAAVALENTRLFEQTQARARREQVLREITARVRGSTDPDAIVRTAVRELGTALGRPTFVRLGSVEQLSQTPVVQAERVEGGQ